MNKDTFCSYCGYKFNTIQYPKKCDNCDNITYKNPIPACTLLVPVENSLLVLKRIKTGKWCLPGGYIEHGETWQEACVRELYEETSGAFERHADDVREYMYPQTVSNGGVILHIGIVSPVWYSDVKKFRPNLEMEEMRFVQNNIETENLNNKIDVEFSIHQRLIDSYLPVKYDDILYALEAKL